MNCEIFFKTIAFGQDQLRYKFRNKENFKWIESLKKTMKKNEKAKKDERKIE
jgi:hypothetical protein